MASRRRNIDMGSGSFLKNIILFAIPIALTGFLQCLYNAADMVVVGKFGSSNSLAAVGATGSPTGLLVNLFLGLSIGASVIVSRSLGEGNREKIIKAVHTAVSIGAIAGVLVALLGFLFCEQLLILMGVPSDILDKSVLYTKIFFVGVPASMLFNFIGAIFRASGNTKTPLIVSLLSGILNVILNCIFVIAFKMDVAGVAAATAISCYFSATISLILLKNEHGPIRFFFKKLTIDKESLKDILIIGIPSGLNSAMYSISNILINTRINSFGSTVVGGHAVGTNISAFLYQLNVTPFAQASVSFIAYNYGAKKYENFKKIIGACLLWAVAVGAAITALLLPFGESVASVYTNSQSEIEIGVLFLTIVGILHWILGISETLNGAIRGLGKSFTAMILSVIGICGIRVIFTQFIFPLFPTISCLYLSYPVSWIITITMQVITFLLLSRSVRKNEGISQ